MSAAELIKSILISIFVTSKNIKFCFVQFLFIIQLKTIEKRISLEITNVCYNSVRKSQINLINLENDFQYGSRAFYKF